MTQNRNAAPDAAPEQVERHVLTVSPDKAWNNLVGKALRGAGVDDFEEVANAEDAIDRLTREDAETITSVITDGLRGNWRRVVEAAQEAGAAPVVMTRSSFPLEGAAEMGIPVFVKQRVESNSIEHERLVRAAVPEQGRTPAT